MFVLFIKIYRWHLINQVKFVYPKNKKLKLDTEFAFIQDVLMFIKDLFHCSYNLFERDFML